MSLDQVQPINNSALLPLSATDFKTLHSSLNHKRPEKASVPDKIVTNPFCSQIVKGSLFCLTLTIFLCTKLHHFADEFCRQ